MGGPRLAVASLVSCFLVLSLAGCIGPSDSDTSRSQDPEGASDGLGVVAPFLQANVDAGRTGSTGDPGPADSIRARSVDVAFAIDVPGLRAYAAPPLILNDTAYVLTGLAGPMVGQAQAPDAGPHALHAIDLDTARRTEALSFADPPTAIASDGQQVFVATQTGVEAYSLRTWEAEWVWPFPAGMEASAGGTVCAPLAVHEDFVYVACSRYQGSEAGDGAGGATGSFVASLTHDGAEQWVWFSEGEFGPTTSPNEAFNDVSSAPGYEVKRLAVAGRAVAVSFIEADRYDVHAPVGEWVVALDISTGDRLWVDFDSSAEYINPDNALPPVAHVAPPGLLATGDMIYIKGQSLKAYVADAGATRWIRNDLAGLDPTITSTPAQFLGNRMGLLGDTLVTTHNDALFGLDAATGETVWGPQRQGSAPAYDDAEGILFAGGVAYVTTYTHNLIAFDPATGDVLLVQDLFRGPFLSRVASTITAGGNASDDGPPDRRLALAVGEGVLVAALWDGAVQVLGRTNASIDPSVSVDDLYPAPGETVRVDLAGTQPGALGSDLEYAVTWGDGTVDSWQDEPAFEHAYDTPGAQEAIVRLRNAAGQTASRSVVFDVGGSPPPVASQPTLLETMFARDNQDLTFGVLGILVALAGGVLAVARSRRRRGLLQRELDAIDRLAQRAESPTELESMFQERRAHIRGLVVDGRLDEAQGQVLERRLDEVQREGRLGEIESLLSQMPHGLVGHVREVLGDGRVSQFERRSLLALVEQEPLLSAKAKRTLARRIDAWFRRDEGADA